MIGILADLQHGPTAETLQTLLFSRLKNINLWKTFIKYKWFIDTTWNTANYNQVLNSTTVKQNKKKQKKEKKKKKETSFTYFLSVIFAITQLQWEPLQL